MDIASIRRAYRFYAPVYNSIFGRIVAEGRREAVKALPGQAGDRILEIGVGTGLSLPLYKSELQVSGIDVSPEMLAIARRKYPQQTHPQVHELLEMDAQDLDFPDDHFAGSVAMYVASVVPDPASMMREMFRVTRPGGPVLVVNHFSSSKSPMRAIERRMTPLSKRIGFRPDFSLEHFLELTGIRPESMRRVNVRGFSKLLEFRAPGRTENAPSADGSGLTDPPELSSVGD